MLIPAASVAVVGALTYRYKTRVHKMQKDVVEALDEAAADAEDRARQPLLGNGVGHRLSKITGVTSYIDRGSKDRVHNQLPPPRRMTLFNDPGLNGIVADRQRPVEFKDGRYDWRKLMDRGSIPKKLNRIAPYEGLPILPLAYRRG